MNLVGLSIGLAVTFIVLLYINEEVGFDRHHRSHENIYRLISNESARQEFSSLNNPQIAKLLDEQIPEIVASTSYTPANFTKGDFADSEGFYYADPAIIDIFTFNFISGNVKQFKKDIYTTIVSETFAKTHFEGTSVVGRTIELGKEDDRATFTISAVFEDFPRKSTFRPTAVLQNYSSPRYRKHIKPEQLGYRGYQSYFKLDKNASIPELTKTMNRVYKTMPDSFNWAFSLQPLEKVHLYSQGITGQPEIGSIKKVMTYAIIGALILIMSLMNFLLLYTSITKQRFKEIAIRKINGLEGRGLLNMFFAESLIISIACALIAFVLMFLFIPSFNSYTNSDLKFDFTGDYKFILYAMSVVLFISSISGLYFHNFIKNLKSVDILNRNKQLRTNNFFFGDSAVLVQLTLVCSMLTFSIGYYVQLDFMLDSGKGFDSDNVLVLRRQNWNPEVFEKEILKYPYIEAVSRGNVLPLYGSSQIFDISLNDSPSSSIPTELMRVDEDYIPLYNIKILQGRNFSNKYASDKSGQSIIINESALKMLNVKQPIGSQTSEGVIIGVVQDFKFESFHKELRPLFFRMPETTEYPEFNEMLTNYGDLIIRYGEGERENAIGIVEKVLENQSVNLISDNSELINPRDREQAYVMFDPEYSANLEDRIYGSEKTLQKVVMCLTLISIIITLFGLVGMSLFKVGQKTKEIAIRKVNGATTRQILILLNKGFAKWIFVGLLLAIPISYFALNRWLQDFAYKSPIYWWFFVLGSLLVLLVSILVVSLQSYRASVAAPVKALRNA